ncbi:carbonic anhydrase 5B, mitochondrial-like [Amblyomma americanum]
MQSPISLKRGSGAIFGAMEVGFNYAVPLSRFKVTFNKFLRMTIDDTTLPSIKIYWKEYFLKEVHFRFRAEDMKGGSEHIMETSADLEVQLIHVRDGKQDILSNVAKKRSVLALSLLYEKASTGLSDEHKDTDTILKAIANRVGAKEEATEAVSLEGLIQRAGVFKRAPWKHFYTYQGSLTYPPCSEGVKWLIPRDNLKVDETTLEALREKAPDTGLRPPKKRRKTHKLRMYEIKYTY